MRASLRWKNFMFAGLLLVPGTAVAQSAPQPPSNNPPAPDSVGPQELQNFSLSGRVTKPADQQAAPAPAPASTGASERDRPATAATGSHERKEPARLAEDRKPRAPMSSRAVAQPSIRTAPVPSAPPFTTPDEFPVTRSTLKDSPFAPSSIPPPADTMSSGHGPAAWLWLLAALALLAAASFLFWRRNRQGALAGSEELDLLVPNTPAAPFARAPVPAPALLREVPLPSAPEPASAPRPAKRPNSGIVSTRLRPSLEIEARPLRCLVEENRVVLEFELELFNSGTAPARAVLAEASLFNAGANQEQELARFFSKPAGTGERLDAIAPMKRISFINEVVAPRDAIQEYELGGRKVFVPVLAFNALYAWSAGEAQTSTAYLVGRETNGEKLGPLSLDGGPRQIGKLAARPLPSVART